MQLNRRQFTTLAAVSAAASPAHVSPMRASGHPNYKAVAFDGFPIIDAQPVFAKVEAIFPGWGTELGNVWRTRQFEYCWLRTLGGRYVDFWQATEDALSF